MGLGTGKLNTQELPMHLPGYKNSTSSGLDCLSHRWILSVCSDSVSGGFGDVGGF